MIDTKCVHMVLKTDSRKRYLGTKPMCGHIFLQEVASVDDMKLTVTTRMFIYMTWKDKRIVYTATDKDDEDIYLVGHCIDVQIG